MDEIKTIREAIQRTKWAIEEWSSWKDSSDPMQGACQVRMSRSSLADAQNALSRLEAREAEAPKDVRELAEKLNYLSKPHIGVWGPDHENEAAAEIERYVQARIASVPKIVNLNDIAELIANMGDGYTDDELHHYFTEHGYTVIEE